MFLDQFLIKAVSPMLFKGFIRYKKIRSINCEYPLSFRKLLWLTTFYSISINTAFGIGFNDPLGALDKTTKPTGMMGVEPSFCLIQSVADADVSLASIQVQTAQVGIAKSAYLPTLSLSGQTTKDRSSNQGTNTNGQPFSYTSNSTNYSASVNFNWVLYDFGLRSSILSNADKSLMSAFAKQDSVLQTVIANTVKDYYTAVVAKKNIVATQQFEANAHQVLEMATARVKGGVAAISDQLQAKTAYAQAIYNRHKAEGDWLSALGVVAIDMGRHPSQNLRLDLQNDATLPSSLVDSVDSLLQSAQVIHPALRSARADLEAAQANEMTIRAQGRPRLSLVSQYSNNKQSESAGGGQPYIDTKRQDRYVGVKLDVPLFEGFGQTYKVSNAQAQTALKQANLASAESEVAASVWTNYQQLKVSATNIQTSQEIVESAQLAYRAAESRYQRGVADIQELLNSQNTFASATQQHIKAIADWQNARIQMAASIGQLNVSTLP
jgi:outer membrane protein